MIIALDYDKTYTADPVMWDMFIKLAKVQGHEVWIVTMRAEHELEDVLRNCFSKVNGILATNYKAKRSAFKNLRGVEPDIWIDDCPQYVDRDFGGLSWPEEQKNLMLSQHKGPVMGIRVDTLWIHNINRHTVLVTHMSGGGIGGKLIIHYKNGSSHGECDALSFLENFKAKEVNEHELKS